MRVLIAYDGSSCSDAALDDLERAGLPSNGDALVVSVAEVWLPPPNIKPEAGRDETDDYIEQIVETHRRKGELLVAAAEAKALQGRERVLKVLSQWNVSNRGTYGSPAWEILSATAEFKADLIVMGSHGQSALSRFILGSVSQKVLTEAHCSVRIARERQLSSASSTRLMLAFDASAGAMATVKAVADRNWSEGTELRLVTAADSSWLSSSDGEWIAKYAGEAESILQSTGLKVSADVINGDPNRVLIEEGEKWQADCIFVGANAQGSRLERFLLGTTSAAIAGRAHCSVEVVRRSS